MSWFKYGKDFWHRTYLSVAIYDDEERSIVEAEIAKGNFERLVIDSGNAGKP